MAQSTSPTHPRAAGAFPFVATWRTAAAWWLDETRPYPDEGDLQHLASPEHILDGIYADARSGDWHQVAERMWAAAIAARRELEDVGLWSEDEMLALLCERQRKYGPENIKSTGLMGVAVRLIDKRSRLVQLRGNRREFGDESYKDTLMDVIGYFVVGMMAEYGWMDLPMPDDTPPNDTPPPLTDADDRSDVWDDEKVSGWP